MIVYSACLRLTNSDALPQIIGAVEDWLRVKKRLENVPSLAKHVGRFDFRSDEFVETARFDDEGISTVAIRYGHPDRTIQGREWLTEIGLEVREVESICTILLHTREASAIAYTEVDTTRPQFVGEIVKRCSLSSVTPGGQLRVLTEDDCEAFEWTVNDPDRRHPLIQISPVKDGGYLVDPNRLNNLLVGVADVVQIPENTDTFAISDAIGARFCAYHGAINILWPTVSRPSGSFVPSTRLLETDLQQMIAEGYRPEFRLLALVGQHTNAANARLHISPERVQTSSLRSALEKARQTKSSDHSELIYLYKQIDDEQRDEIAELKSKFEITERELSAVESKVEEQANTIASLKGQLQQVSSVSALNNNALKPDERAVLAKAALGKATLPECLTAIELLYSDRVIILSSAKSSAADAKKFKSPQKAFELMSKLCDEYVDAKVSGKGDYDAKNIFGNKAFSARESECVESNANAKKLRTFRYKNTDTLMMAHLRIGNKQSVAETWRCHFLWDHTNKVIVIGHCGKHLDHK